MLCIDGGFIKEVSQHKARDINERLAGMLAVYCLNAANTCATPVVWFHLTCVTYLCPAPLAKRKSTTISTSWSYHFEWGDIVYQLLSLYTEQLGFMTSTSANG